MGTGVDCDGLPSLKPVDPDSSEPALVVGGGGEHDRGRNGG
jgi:hypothetical protein